MKFTIIVPIVQFLGVLIPLIGCIVMFRREQIKASMGRMYTNMSLMITNIGCLIMNAGYWLLLWSETEEGAWIALKMQSIGSVLFYLYFLVFIATYLKIQQRAWVKAILLCWGSVDVLMVCNLWLGDPLHWVYKMVEFKRLGKWDVTNMMAEPGFLYMVRHAMLAFILFWIIIYTLLLMYRTKIEMERNNLAKLVGAEIVIVWSLLIDILIKLPFDSRPIFASGSILFIILGVLKGEFFNVTDQGREWVIEHSDNIFIISDSMYGYLDANPCAKQAFPELNFLLKNQMLPKQIKELFTNEDCNIHIGERHYTKEVEAISQEGKIQGYSLLLVDVTQQCLLLHQVEEEKERAEEANQAKSMFMSNMSHEIRTPMNAIVGMTDILLREELPERTKEYLYNIKNSGNALITIINDILDFSKIESGKMEIIEDDYEPMSMFHDVSMIFLNRIGDKNVELIYDIDTKLPLKLHGDSQRIRQVIINLMNNAIKFTEAGYVKLTVSIQKQSREEIELLFQIKDSGQGIREEDIGKLFGSFQQVDTKKNHYKEGTGLGLAICKQLVTLMGGTIGVESEYGKGSTFYFTISQKIQNEKPAAQIRRKPAEEVVVSGRFDNELILVEYEKLIREYGVCEIKLEQAILEQRKIDTFFTDDPGSVSKEEREQLEKWKTSFCILQNPMQQNLSGEHAMLINKPIYSLNFCQAINREEISYSEAKEKEICFTAPDAKILIVDDAEMNLKVAIGLLEPLHLQIDTAENGKNAVEKIKKQPYDIVFMDHMMPIMDGIEATKVIRGLEGEYYQKLPIVALTANATTEAKESFRANGLNDFVAKPIKVQEICKCIRRWLPEEKIHTAEKSAIQENVLKDKGEEELPAIEGLDVAAGIENSGSKKLFISLLGDFYKLIDQKSEKIEKCLADGMLRDYTVEVHALKNTARMIGALELSEKFYHLEQLGNAGEQKTLEIETPEVLTLYRSYKPILAVYGKLQEKDKKRVPVEEIIQSLEELRNAMDGFDLDGADVSMKKIESYIFPGDSYQEKIERLSAYVADVAMEDVMNLSEELIAVLKNEA
ncbi:MAG: ATP-binding protein [Agathobacter sp.]